MKQASSLKYAVWWSIPMMWVLQWGFPQSGPLAGWVLGVIAGSLASYGAICKRSNV